MLLDVENYLRMNKRRKEVAASTALRAAALLEIGSTKGVKARNKDGKERNPCEDDARSFCTIGAIERATFEIGNGSAEDLVFSRLIDKTHGKSIDRINDENIHGIQMLINALRSVARDLDKELRDEVHDL